MSEARQEQSTALPRRDRTRYVLPRTLIARVVLAWSIGFVVIGIVHAIDRGDDRGYAQLAFWTATAILVGFVVGDTVRAYRRRH